MSDVTQELLLASVVACYGMMTVVLLGNLLYLRKRPIPESDQPSVSILIPARNEAANLRRLLPALASQEYPDLEVIVYDDESTDRTWEVIQQFEGGRISGIRGGPLPDGWVGKCHALHESAKKARGEVLVFLDADTMFAHDRVLANLVSEFASLPPFSVLTIMPGLHPSGGRLLVSLIPNVILLTIPWFLTRKLRIPAISALNGQCWVIHAEDYGRLEPHKKQKKQILEDVAIAEDLVLAGMHIRLTATRGQIDVRMYESLEEAWRGFRKNVYLFLGGSPSQFILLQIPFIVVFLIAPFYLPWLFVWMILLKMGSDRVAGFSPLISLLAPVSYAMGLALDWDSAWHHWRGRVMWKGRKVG